MREEEGEVPDEEEEADSEWGGEEGGKKGQRQVGDEKKEGIQEEMGCMA